MSYRKILLRRGTASAWTSSNPVLSSGEFGFETDTGKLKIGDGTTAWTSLTYFAPSTLNDVGDVTVTSASSGDFLKWNGSQWVNDPINLGTDTTGNYMSGVTAGTGISVSHTPGEGSSATISIGQEVNTTSNVQFNDVTVAGNLTVSGTTTTVNSETLTVNDNIVVLNNNVTGSPTENAGIEVERGTSANVQLRWNETSDKWELTVDGTNYADIATEAYVDAQSIAALDDIGDVTITSIANGQFLKWNGTAWVNDAIDLGTDTTGNYMSGVTAGTGVTVTHTPGEGSSATIAIGQAVATSDSPQFAGVNVGHATDTTITRVTAGQIAVEGVNVVTTSSTDTLSNKTISNGTLTGTLTAGGTTGSNGQVLQSSGTGVTWATPAAGGGGGGISSSYVTISNNAPTVIGTFDAANIAAEVIVYAERSRDKSIASWKNLVMHDGYAAWIQPTQHMQSQGEWSPGFIKAVFNAQVRSNGTFWEFVPNANLVNATSGQTNISLTGGAALGSVRGLAFNGTAYAGVGAYRFRSTDLVTWTTGTVSGTAYAMDYSPSLGKFYAVGSSSHGMATSTDGTTWTSVANPGGMTYIDVATNGTKFIAIVDSGYLNGSLRESTDFVTWTTLTTPLTSSSYPLRSITYTNNRWIITHYGNRISHSTDSVTWTSYVSHSVSQRLRRVVYSSTAGRYAGVSEDTRHLCHSTDLITWVSVRPNIFRYNAGTPFSEGEYGFDCLTVGANGIFLAGYKAHGLVYKSTDGLTWGASPCHLGNYYYVQAITYNSTRGEYLAGGTNGQIRRGYAGTDNLVAIEAWVSSAFNSTASNVTQGPVRFKTLTLPMSGA